VVTKLSFVLEGLDAAAYAVFDHCRSPFEFSSGPLGPSLADKRNVARLNGDAKY
jgi:hypothetical protein